MANFVFNIAKGRVAELFHRVDQNDPANCAIVVVAINAGGATDATMRDYDTLALLLADANVAEVTNANYARKVLVDSDIAVLTPDDTNDRMQVTIADQTWSAVGAGDAWTDLIICYDPDTTNGSSTIIPLTCHDFVGTPNGGDITAAVGVNGVYQAS
jgi:hypothetical protein